MSVLLIASRHDIIKIVGEREEEDIVVGAACYCHVIYKIYTEKRKSYKSLKASTNLYAHEVTTLPFNAFLPS